MTVTRVERFKSFLVESIFDMCFIMLMANRSVVLCCAECVVQHISWLVNVQVLGAPRWLTGDGEGQARSLCVMD